MPKFTKPHVFGAAILLLALYACAAATSPPVATQNSNKKTVGGKHHLYPQATPTPINITIQTTSGGSTAIPLQLLGANLPTWFNFEQSYVTPALMSAAMNVLRFPGGGYADHYHWDGQNWYQNPQKGSLAPTVCGTPDPLPTNNPTFDNFMNTVQSIGTTATAAITVDYGSDASCDGGAKPGEAAAWVAYVKQNYPGRVSRWTVGNEVYLSGEYDLNTPLPDGSPDPGLYAQSFASPNGYYSQMKAADSTAQVGISVRDDGCCDSTNWNATVMPSAKPYDFVEAHFYAFNPNSETITDDNTLGEGITRLDGDVANVQTWLTQYGYSGKSIYIGELNSSIRAQPSGALTRQTVSIVNGLFAGMAIAELAQANASPTEDDANVVAATWYDGIDGSCTKDTTGDQNIYGYQDFGTFALFSNGSTNCDSIPAGTLFPTGRVYQALANYYFQSGSLARTVNCTPCTGSSPPVRAYAITRGSGYAILLFNLVDNGGAQPQDVTLTVNSLRGTPFAATGVTYGKNEYDLTKNGNSNPSNWVGPTALTPFSVSSNQPFTITLNPWSMTIIDLK